MEICDIASFLPLGEAKFGAGLLEPIDKYHLVNYTYIFQSKSFLYQLKTLKLRYENALNIIDIRYSVPLKAVPGL